MHLLFEGREVSFDSWFQGIQVSQGRVIMAEECGTPKFLGQCGHKQNKRTVPERKGTHLY